jgi:glycosyltransferase involved in cell wall biosynthesis
LVQAGYQLVYEPRAIVYHRNERTPWGLMHEGWVHGYHAVKVRALHAGFLTRRSRARKARNVVDSPSPPPSLWENLFERGKSIGRSYGEHPTSAKGMREAVRRASRIARWQMVKPLIGDLYRSIAARLAALPLESSPSGLSQAAPRIGYFHHAFPILSETFVQREVAALRRCGIAVEVIAHEARGETHFDGDAKRLMETTTYMPRMGPTGIHPDALELAVQRPAALFRAAVYAIGRRQGPRKSFRADRHLFNRAVQLAQVARAKGITHLHCPFAGLDASVALMAASLAGIAYSVQARASDIHRSASAPYVGERLAHARFVVTNARYNESALHALPNASAAHMRVIYEGVDVRRFRPRVARPSSDRARVLCVARLVAPKGLEVLIRACALLRDRDIAFGCEIVGGRDDAELNYHLELLKLRRRLGIENEVVLAGARTFDEVMEKYAASDLFVLPAVTAPDGRRDVTPNVLIEAMAMKLPVISTRSGAIPELVEDGVTGILVPPGDAPSLADAIERLLGDPALSGRLAVAARRSVEERFDIDKNIRGYVELFGASCATAASTANDDYSALERMTSNATESSVRTAATD